MHAHRPLALLGALALLGGCAASPWRESFAPAAMAPPLPKGAPVQLREVPWDRIMDARRELEAEAAASDVHPDEWPPERRAAAKERLLRALQVSEPPGAVDVVGRSEFSSAAALRPETPQGAGELSRVAREVGATRVVWSRRLLGKADVIVQEPITTFSHGTDFFRDRDRRGRSSGFYSEQSTAWVPIVVRADEWAYVAYFLRI